MTEPAGTATSGVDEGLPEQTDNSVREQDGEQDVDQEPDFEEAEFDGDVAQADPGVGEAQ